jgi:peptidyl-prolyl cis-trans isomerase D
MLNVMRENLRHLKWVLFIVAASMTLYLGTGFLGNKDSGGPSAPWAAKVNDSEISTRDFLSATRNMNDYYAGVLGEQYAQFKPQLRLGTQAIQQLINQQIQLEEASKLGFRASDQELADLIRNDSRFQDENGQFVGAEQYKTYFQRQWVGGVEAFEAELAKDIASRKWADLVGQAVKVSPVELEEAYRQRYEKTRIRYLVVASADQPTAGPVPESEIEAWYNSHQDDYMQGVRRKIRYAVVERRSVLEEIEVTDSEIGDYYGANQASYETPEQRRASHILLQVLPSATAAEKDGVKATAEAILARVRAGESIADLAPELSVDTISAARGGDLGFFGRGAMVPTFDAAVFSTPVGEFADVVETDFGYHVIQVTGERDAGIQPLDEVREDIRTRISLDKAQELIREKAGSLSAAAVSPEEFTAAAEAAGLEVAELTAAATDNMTELAPSPEFRNEMFELPVGGISGPVVVARGMAVFAVDEEFPPAVAPLADVRLQVESAYRNERLRKMAVTAARKALGAGDLDRAARSLDQEVQDSGDLAPGRVVLPGIGGDSDELSATLFDDGTVIGNTGVIQVPAGALIYEVTDRTPFDQVAFETGSDLLHEELLTQKRQLHLQSILNRLREDYRIEINSELINQYDS